MPEIPRSERKKQNRLIALCHNELGQPTIQSTLNHELLPASVA
ncbi:MAG: hypothetical protein ABSA83_20530 [Verrucomicrobiota bacterium]|jgi:hypothetical protein